MFMSKKFCHQKDIANYPDGCKICLKFFIVGCASAVDKSTKILKIKGNEGEQEKTNAWSVQYMLFSFLDLVCSLNLFSFVVHHIAFFQEADGTCPSNQVSKAFVFKHQLLFR